MLHPLTTPIYHRMGYTRALGALPSELLTGRLPAVSVPSTLEYISPSSLSLSLSPSLPPSLSLSLSLPLSLSLSLPPSLPLSLSQILAGLQHTVTTIESGPSVYTEAGKEAINSLMRCY